IRLQAGHRQDAMGFLVLALRHHGSPTFSIKRVLKKQYIKKWTLRIPERFTVGNVIRIKFLR
ncbi:hypothetical protein R0K04_22475, partial [Pseudoalteromonas sp. SIMBA_153]